MKSNSCICRQKPSPRRRLITIRTSNHIHHLRDFPDTRFYCSGAGWQSTRSLRGIGALRRGFVPGLMPADFEQRVGFVEVFGRQPLPAALTPFHQGYALPDSAGEVFLVELPGHAAGHLGAFVHTPEGWVLLASDAAWSPTSYRELIGPSPIANLIMENPRTYHATLRQLHALHRNGQVEIRLTHEGAL